MFKIIQKSADETTLIENYRDPVELEARYFALCKQRTNEAQSVIIVPSSGIVAPANYRLDFDWDGPREQNGMRCAQIWGPPDEGWTQPTEYQMRGLCRAAGISGGAAAALVGIDGRTWRRYLAPVNSADHRVLSWATWFTLLVRTGFVRTQEYSLNVGK